MIELSLFENEFRIRAGAEDLRPRHESQLAYWGLRSETDGIFSCSISDANDVVFKVANYLANSDLEYSLDSELSDLFDSRQKASEQLIDAQNACRKLKDGRVDPEKLHEFVRFAERALTRKLKEHQIKAALHLLTAINGANFSVPGSGKTTVVLAAFQRLRELGDVDSLFVVGPPACFGPWREEYGRVLGAEPVYSMLAGGDIDDRRSRYLVSCNSVPDLFLTTFQTLQRDQHQVATLFRHSGVRFYLVIDEAHYIKQLDGCWANAVLSVAKCAERRCILTGTPFPRSLSDAFNSFDVLWPTLSPLSYDDRHRIEMYSQHNQHAEAATLLEERIGPLFYRVRKDDLGLAPQVFHEPIRIRMKPRERLVYDSILDRITFASHSEFYRDFELRVRLRRGRMIRLRQCTSYVGLLTTAVSDYDEDLLDKNKSLAEVIRNYDELETPGKVDALMALLQQLFAETTKVVIWSNFVGTLKLLKSTLKAAGYRAHLIYGGTPFERADVEDALSRESIIRAFIDSSNGVNVLIANPAACAESISLHQACSHAIYYDLSYNCAQYLQSLDRIHRVGGSENRSAHYYVLQYEDSLDQDILLNVQKKADIMSHIIDRDYAVYSLDMFSDTEDLDAYERLFGDRNEPS